MHSLPVPTTLRHATLLAGLLTLSTLPACMVVPLEPRHLHSPSQAPVVLQAPLGPQLLNVRLYPVNAEGSSAGPLSAVVTDHHQGRGSFSINYQGRTLQGEATRVGNDHPGFGTLLFPALGDAALRTQGRRGIANAAGAGLHAQCEYILTGAQLGVGACLFSDGARFQMHFGQ